MRTLIKICGLTRLEDARFAAEAGADVLGFVFVPGTPRAVTSEQVRAIVRELPPNVKKAGVFRDADDREIRKIMDFCNLDIVQLHGSETPELARTLALEYEVWKAVAFTSPEAFAQSQRFRDFTLVADSDKRGNDCDWSLVQLPARRLRLILAGGIAPENAAHAVETVAPAGLDVCSGVEDAPGLKNHSRITQLINLVRKADLIQEEYHEKYAL